MQQEQAVESCQAPCQAQADAQENSLPTEFADFLNSASTAAPPAKAVSFQAETIRPERPLFNSGDPQYVLQREKPEHRIIIFLKSQGHSNVEIAEKLGLTPTAINYIVKQPWAQAQIVEEITKAGRDEVEVLLEGEVAESVRKLIELRDSTEASPEVQRKAANDILDRFYGKPNQRIITSSVDANTMTNDELERIARKGLSN